MADAACEFRVYVYFEEFYKSYGVNHFAAWISILNVKILKYWLIWGWGGGGGGGGVCEKLSTNRSNPGY